MTEEAHVYAERIAEIEQRIERACRESDRSRDEVTLIVVSKFHPQETVRALASIGVKDFGENRHQEARAKARETEDLDIRWHFVGQLQSNKARQAAQYASSIHSLDREAVIDALATIEQPIDGFLQVNMTADEGRGGIEPADLERMTEHVLGVEAITLRGVMAVAPLGEEAGRAFERLRGYSERVQALAPEATSISAGMTHDFEEALRWGATHLRIGSAITGNRAY
ncbi:YggS family pyridoxal phosphate-dependent enzyme [Leucobacter sp. UCMA 4100]|uniref:YggS family pyridoxal phosphate-dependent enzyme n=1 Tax=Leucobacter sp. UCMA 4100 TaxID=2810534 RepID=UPI0022EAA18D|nr:YggS family pyridoxal phosphate-dependent enzyme [Leucobacter sp. UCMA 4100]